MDFTFNNNAVSSITYNGLDINILRYNGTTVWEKNRDYDPADYGLTQYEWMKKSTGDTGTSFLLSDSYSVFNVYETQMQWKPNTSNYHGSGVLGHRGANTNTNFCIFREYYVYMDYGVSGRRTVSVANYDTSDIYTYQFWIDSSFVGHIKNVDTTEQDTDGGFGTDSNPMTNITQNMPFYIFDTGDCGTIYYLKVYDTDGTTLLHHWVPCQNNSNNELCWFDIKTGDTVYASSNSGLSVGNGISYDISLSSSSSTWTQRYVNSTLSYSCDVQCTATSDSSWLHISSTGTNYVYYRVDNMTDVESRTGTITLSNSGGGSATFFVYQYFDHSIYAYYNNTYYYSDFNINFDNFNTQTFTLRIDYKGFDLSVTAPSWITVTQTSTSGSYWYYDVTVDSASEDRTGGIVFSDRGYSRTCTVRQYQTIRPAGVPDTAAIWNIYENTATGTTDTYSFTDTDATGTYTSWNQMYGNPYVGSYRDGNGDSGSRYVIFDANGNSMIGQTLQDDTPYYILCNRRNKYLQVVTIASSSYNSNFYANAIDISTATAFYLKNAGNGQYCIYVIINGTSYYLCPFDGQYKYSSIPSLYIKDADGNTY